MFQRNDISEIVIKHTQVRNFRRLSSDWARTIFNLNTIMKKH